MTKTHQGCDAETLRSCSNGALTAVQSPPWRWPDTRLTTSQASVISEPLLHLNGIDDQDLVLEKVEAASKGWNTESSGVRFWRYMLVHRREQKRRLKPA